MPPSLHDIQVTREPLPEGKYYLVDISEVINEYLALPESTRLCPIGDGLTYSALDMLDIELETIIPCLDSQLGAEKEMKAHIEELLDDGIDQVRFLMKEQGVDTETRTILNTPDQLDHAKAVSKLAEGLYGIFHEHKLYNENGSLIGEHCTLLDDNTLVLRET